MLSKRFCVNSIYSKNISSLNGMKEVRKYAAKKLNDLTDEELNFILLQLVQALRYEDFSDSPLMQGYIQPACLLLPLLFLSEFP